MHDYKFSQSDLSFGKPKRARHKMLRRAVGLALVAGVVYGIVHLGLPWQGGSEAPETDSLIIPLPLPPHAEPEESTKPVNSDSTSPAGIPKDRAFTGAMKAMQEPGRAGFLATTSQRPTDAEGGLEQALDAEAVTATGEDAQSATQETQIQAGNEDGTWIEHEVKPGDSLAKIFRDNDLSPQLLQSILRSGKEARHLKTIRPKDQLRIHLDRERQFAELHLQLDALRSVKFSTTGSGIEGTKVRKETQTKAIAVSGVIDHTLFSSASKAGLPDTVIMQLAKIFGWDIDFALEIRPRDSFTVIYEELWADDEQVGSGNIIAAEFVNRGRSHRAIRFTNALGKTDYYSPEGMPLRKSFFRTPVKFTRISSGFSKRRWHPVLKRSRAHKGVDYAARSGTPIIATGDATVEYKGWKKGYGRAVYLRHGRKYRTVYGHMSRFAKGLSKGDRVRQGEVIGYVGQSGLATGPHLHYEFHVDGVHRNPLAVKAPIADPLPPKEMKKFRKIAVPLLASLEQTATDTLLADAR